MVRRGASLSKCWQDQNLWRLGAGGLRSGLSTGSVWEPFSSWSAPRAWLLWPLHFLLPWEKRAQARSVQELPGGQDGWLLGRGAGRKGLGMQDVMLSSLEPCSINTSLLNCLLLRKELEDSSS